MKDKTLKALHTDQETDTIDGYSKVVRILEQNGLVKSATAIAIISGTIQVKKDYINELRKNFNAEVFMNKSFDVVQSEVNSFVDEKTDSVIKEFQIDQHTESLLLNVLYFKAMFMYEFDEDLTDENDKCDGMYGADQTTCSMMKMNSTSPFAYLENVDGHQLLCMPYINNLKDKNQRVDVKNVFYLMAVLPKHNTDKSLNQAQELTNHSCIFERERKQFFPKFMKVEFPKLNIELGNLELDNYIKNNLGLEDYYSSGSLTSLSDNMKISKVQQKVVLRIDERGTVAVAVTSLEDGDGERKDVFKLRFDRPFAVAIKAPNDFGNLFTGVVKDLSSK
eukprot:GHVR01178699.1.p1 GENE.GHVR01178699.1~~GHVR01178699.1.p1  ORF type:complete len:335 (+),score=54.14 GHVR01178699.1:374-1378(+)